MSILSRLANPLRSNPQRAINTHDASVSARHFNGAVEAARRYYDLAMREASRGDEVHAWQYLLTASDWIGQAQAHLEYVDETPRMYDEFMSMYQWHTNWGNDLQQALR